MKPKVTTKDARSNFPATVFGSVCLIDRRHNAIFRLPLRGEGLNVGCPCRHLSRTPVGTCRDLSRRVKTCQNVSRARLWHFLFLGPQHTHSFTDQLAVAPVARNCFQYPATRIEHPASKCPNGFFLRKKSQQTSTNLNIIASQSGIEYPASRN